MSNIGNHIKLDGFAEVPEMAKELPMWHDPLDWTPIELQTQGRVHLVNIEARSLLDPFLETLTKRRDAVVPVDLRSRSILGKNIVEIPTFDVIRRNGGCQGNDRVGEHVFDV